MTLAVGVYEAAALAAAATTPASSKNNCCFSLVWFPLELHTRRLAIPAAAAAAAAAVQEAAAQLQPASLAVCLYVAL